MENLKLIDQSRNNSRKNIYVLLKFPRFTEILAFSPVALDWIKKIFLSKIEQLNNSWSLILN